MGEPTDLGRLLAGLDPVRRAGDVAFVTFPAPDAAAAAVADASVREDEGWTYVVPVEAAIAHGWAHDGAFAWLTLRVPSALADVGLTAAFSAALTEAGISCNVLAAVHHDHLLVPADRADDALAALHALADRHR